MLGAWIILGTIGMILQFKITAKDLQEGGNVCPCSLKTLCCGFCGFLKCCNSSCCDNQKNDGKRNSSECDSSPVYLYIQRPYQDTGGHQQISR